MHTSAVLLYIAAMGYPALFQGPGSGTGASFTSVGPPPPVGHSSLSGPQTGEH